MSLYLLSAFEIKASNIIIIIILFILYSYQNVPPIIFNVCIIFMLLSFLFCIPIFMESTLLWSFRFALLIHWSLSLVAIVDTGIINAKLPSKPHITSQLNNFNIQCINGKRYLKLCLCCILFQTNVLSFL